MFDQINPFMLIGGFILCLIIQILVIAKAVETKKQLANMEEIKELLRRIADK